ncbi:FHA domain-containing protein [Calorimonas adulescens]|uniref:FHA domain-containing protein n=1 Tax=Calorimonas adulescens TaxID=2606906 RepID=A0A5D8QEG9_9THEO|nr:FHA domain-containing protein [Calorimonas adulescens]TZE83110.1 FHA domain-containing protein [Calorimonas adulescens]
MYEFLSGLFKWILLSIVYFFLFNTIQVIRLTGWYGEKLGSYLICADDPGMRFELKDDTIIGRGEDCDIVLNNPFISSKHARIKRGMMGFYIEDLKSTNGTIINGKKIEGSRKLRDKDVIMVGPVKLIYRS